MVVKLVPNFSIPGGRHILGFALIVLSIVIAISSYRHWAESGRALRLGKPLPPSVLPRTLGAGVALVSLVALS
jgi:putative membrane protein